jgi:hypothetical protein
VEAAERAVNTAGGQVLSELAIIDAGLAHRGGSRVVIPHRLLQSLRDRKLQNAAGANEKGTGLNYRPVESGDRVSGTYRRSLQLENGRFAVLDVGAGFSY